LTEGAVVFGGGGPAQHGNRIAWVSILLILAI
jgi:hypothetical protein